MGPNIIFDKSALQALSVNESVWLDAFYTCNITPLFFVETLADLEKRDDRRGRDPEQLVRELADKAPLEGYPNVHHEHLCLSEMLTGPLEMRGDPVLPRGVPVQTEQQRGMTFEQAPEVEALQRWQRREFHDIERLYARRWREGLSTVDLKAVRERYRRAGHPRLPDPNAAKAAAARLVRADGSRYATLLQAMNAVMVPASARPGIIRRWKSLGRPALPEFAPYTAHVLTVDVFFELAIGSDVIGHDKPSNKVDIAYLYYLPFCNVFASGDRLHKRCVPLFLAEHHGEKDGRPVSVWQEFVTADELKADLAKLDAHYSALPDEVKERGVTEFAHNPPVDGDFLVTRLWDRFLPGWRENLTREPPSPEVLAAALKMAKAMARAQPLREEAARAVNVENAGFVMFKRRVPTYRGTWRMVSREAEASRDDDG